MVFEICVLVCGCERFNLIPLIGIKSEEAAFTDSNTNSSQRSRLIYHLKAKPTFTRRILFNSVHLLTLLCFTLKQYGTSDGIDNIHAMFLYSKLF